jgi:uncharacterized membrane protein HdeD (DUF308 family)
MNAPVITHPLRSRRSDHGRQAPRWLLWIGAVEIVLGLIAIVWPAVAGVSIAVLIGSLLVAAAGAGLAATYSTHGWSLVWRLVLSGFSGLAGVYVLVYPDRSLIGLTALLAVLLLASGAVLLATAVAARENRGILAVTGLVDLALGVFVWVELPSSAAWAIGLLAGCHFLVGGVRTVTLGFELRRGHAGTEVRMVGSGA